MEIDKFGSARSDCKRHGPSFYLLWHSWVSECNIFPLTSIWTRRDWI